MIKLFIFVLMSLFPQGETYRIRDEARMFFSDALPVQFWLEGCDTYNNSDAFGVHSKCWFQPFKCSDPIVIQFTDDAIGVNTEPITLPALTDWQTRSTSGALVDWTTGAAPSVNLPIAGSELLYANYAFIAGRSYTITVNYTRVVNSGSSNPRTTTLGIYDDSYNAIFTQLSTAGAGANVATIDFIATDLCTKVAISHTSGADVTITVDSRSGTVSTDTDYLLKVIDEDGATLETLSFVSEALPADGNLYATSIVPEDYDICNQKIKLEVWENEGTASRVAYTDYLDIKTNHPGTKLIEYTGNRNFSGLIYSSTSPDEVFYIRVPCRFFHETFPQTDEAMELTTSVITTSSQKKKQKLLEVIHAPYYFHNKLIEVLQHHTAEIDNTLWKKENAYEINQGEKRWPLKTATCLLTQKNSLVRNVI